MGTRNRILPENTLLFYLFSSILGEIKRLTFLKDVIRLRQDEDLPSCTFLLRRRLLMRKGFKYEVVVLGLLVCLISTLSSIRTVQAQHIDVFKLGPGGSGDPSEREKYTGALDTETIKVEDHYSYEVPVEKDKISKDEVLRTDIELIELVTEQDKAPYLWHQVKILEEVNVTQNHTRIVGNILRCTRARSGVIFWVPGGVKYVAWDKWSSWNCSKEK